MYAKVDWELETGNWRLRWKLVAGSWKLNTGLSMSKRFTIVTVALTAVVAFLVGLIIAGEFTPSNVVVTAPRGLAPGAEPARPAALSLGPAVVNFADVAERINAAVVNVDSMTKGGDSG